MKKPKTVRDNPDYFKSKRKKSIIKSAKSAKSAKSIKSIKSAKSIKSIKSAKSIKSVKSTKFIESVPKEKTSLELYMEAIKTPSDYGGTEEFTHALHAPIRDVTEELIWTDNEIRNALLFLYERHRHKGAVLSNYDISTRDNVLHFIDKFGVIVFPSIVISYWKTLMHDTKIKIIFILTATYSPKNEGHATWTIIDKVRKKVEFFDPHGSYIIDNPNLSYMWNMNFVEVFRNKFLCKTQLSSTLCFIPTTYKISEYKESCLLVGFQGYEMNSLKKEGVDIKGYCMFWSLFFMDLRLSNLKMETKQVQEEFKNIIINDVKNMIISQSLIKPDTNDVESKNIKKLLLRQKFKEFIRSYVLFIKSLHN